MVVILADAITTEGPFDEEESDYIESSDMLSAAVELGRDSVLEGVPLTLIVNIFNISDGNTGYELEDVEVFLWHCDALGIYSAVDSPQQTENTEGQKWLRGKQTTDTDGSVTFNTILPGWYGGRAVHYHIRMRLPGETTYIATTQFFVADDDLAMYENEFPYTEGTMFQTPLATDNIYSGVSPAAAELLTLKLEGSLVEGYTASVNLGLQGMEESVQVSNGPGGPGGNQDRPSPPGGDSDQTATNVTADVSENDEAGVETNTAGTSGATMVMQTVSLSLYSVLAVILLVR